MKYFYDILNECDRFKIQLEQNKRNKMLTENIVAIYSARRKKRYTKRKVYKKWSEVNNRKCGLIIEDERMIFQEINFFNFFL